MPNLIEEADAEFQKLRQEDNLYSVIKLRTGNYDFLTAQEPEIIPIHFIEARRQEERRRGVVDASATPLDFIKSIGIDAADTRDPTNGYSILQVEETSRAYYGNPEAEIYRAYRMQMLHLTDEEQWLKQNTFLEGQMVYDRERMKYSANKRGEPEPGPTEPVTNFKNAFFERKPHRRAPTSPSEELTLLSYKLLFPGGAVAALAVSSSVDISCSLSQLMRRFARCTAAASASAATGCALKGGAAAYHLPGWKTQLSTKDARSREQREADRKARQVDKLPRPEALHDFQYPYEKTVLSDSMFEYPVYESELDTPHLCNLTPPPDFFIYWNATDFERTSYPPVPKCDHRALVPSPQSPQWLEHRVRLLQYLRKHEVCPAYVPRVKADVNLSVVFPGQYSTRARLTDDAGEPIPVPPPETQLTPRNFWFTAHCGNYIELTDLQQPPSIFFFEEDGATARSTKDGSVAVKKESASTTPNYYTLIIVSPDYPYRLPLSRDRQHADKGFFLNYMVANLPAQSAAQVNGTVVDTQGLQKKGDVVIPYVAPLPTEEAGTTRHLCLLFKQTRLVPNVRPLSHEEERRHFPLAVRSNFRLHTVAKRVETGATPSPAACLASLRSVEDAIPADPSAVTFFTTKWDIQVQEYYEKVGLPEPAAPVDEEVDALLEYHATPPARLRVRARHRADGSVNDGADPHFWGQVAPTRMLDGSMQRGAGWSRRTAMGSNGVPIIYPH